MMGKITLLVGGNGLVGRELASIISETGKETSILDGVMPTAKGLIPKGTDEVFFVAQSADQRNEIISEDLFFVNTALVLKFVREAAAIGVRRFAFCSTGSVYVPSPKPLKEESALLNKDISPYAATKLASEMLLMPWKDIIKRLVIFRPFYIYGPGQNEDRLIPSMFRRVINGREIQLSGKEGFIFNPIYVTDAARFMLRALRMKEGFDIYNVAGASKTSLFEVTSAIGLLLNKKPRFIYRKIKDKDVLLGDIRKMKATGFRHKTGLKEGLSLVHSSIMQGAL